MVHPHLKYRDIMLRLQAQQLQRQAEVVVQVAFGLQHVELRAEHRSYALLRGRLARRARDADHTLAPLLTHPFGQRLHRCKHAIFAIIRNPHQLGLIEVRRRQPSLTHHRSRSPIRNGGLDIIMSIDALALHREEQLPGANGARINRIRNRLGITVEVAFGMNPVRNLSQRQLHLFIPTYFVKASS